MEPINTKFYTIENPKLWPSEALFDQTLKIKVCLDVNQIILWTLQEPSGSFGPPCKLTEANDPDTLLKRQLKPFWTHFGAKISGFWAMGQK